MIERARINFCLIFQEQNFYAYLLPLALPAETNFFLHEFTLIMYLNELILFRNVSTHFCNKTVKYECIVRFSLFEYITKVNVGEFSRYSRKWKPRRNIDYKTRTRGQHKIELSEYNFQTCIRNHGTEIDNL